MQTLHTLPESDIYQMFERMGYDESLYSTKSKIFVCTIHAENTVNVSIKNAIGTRVLMAAQNLKLDDILKREGTGPTAKEDDNVIVFAAQHKKAYARTYGAVNKTDKVVNVTIDMTPTENAYFTPKCGTVTVRVPPSSLKYICSCIADPSAESISFQYTFDSEECDEAGEEEGEPTADEEE